MPPARLQRSLRATFLGMATNAVLSAVKLAAGILGHSHALVADAVESFADVFSSLIVWRGVIVAAEPADEDHPYGHGKAEPLAAAIVSGMLLLAAGWIAAKAFGEITTPHQTPAPFTLVVLVVAVVVKEILFRFVRREAGAVDNAAVRTDAWHHRSDAITSFAAGIGISVSLAGGKGYEAADDWAAMAAACVIAWNGWRLLRPAHCGIHSRHRGCGKMLRPQNGPSTLRRNAHRSGPGDDGIALARTGTRGEGQNPIRNPASQ